MIVITYRPYRPDAQSTDDNFDSWLQIVKIASSII
jgi:hypothetical protein